MDKSKSYRSCKSNSFDSVEPKWSWADPAEDRGPGAYELPKYIGVEKKNSGTIGRGKKVRSQFHSKEILSSTYIPETPSPLDYIPNDTIRHRKASMFKFGTGPARKLDFIDCYKQRSPGPIYNNTGFKSRRGYSFQKTNRKLDRAELQEPVQKKRNTPSPVSYEVPPIALIKSTVRQPRLTAARKVDKLYLTNCEFFMLGKDAPGPGTHEPGLRKDLKSNTGFKFHSAARDVVPCHSESPGPASYCH